MQYDSQAQKNLVMNALADYSVPLGQRGKIDPVVSQLAAGQIVPPAPPQKPASVKSVKKAKGEGRKKK